MEELITWAASLQEKDIVAGVFMTFGIGFVLFLLGVVLQVRMEVAKKRTNPHTMSENEYIRLNDKRFSTKKGDTGAGYSSSTGSR
jgi:uncharacterized membrane protein